MTQRDGMGREEGAGFRMGNTGIPVEECHPPPPPPRAVVPTYFEFLCY